MLQNGEFRLSKSVLDGLKDRKRLRQEVDDKKRSKRKHRADENIDLNEMVVQRRIILKHQK